MLFAFLLPVNSILWYRSKGGVFVQFFFLRTFFQQIAHANILVQGEIIFRLTIDPALIAGSMGDVITYFVALRS